MARRMLQQRAHGEHVAGEMESAAAIEDAWKAEAAREKEAERKQKEVEHRAYMGLDGPRPCMTLNGKPI